MPTDRGAQAGARVTDDIGEHGEAARFRQRADPDAGELERCVRIVGPWAGPMIVIATIAVGLRIFFIYSAHPTVTTQPREILSSERV
jgi:hypothetical protein